MGALAVATSPHYFTSMALAARSNQRMRQPAFNGQIHGAASHVIPPLPGSALALWSAGQSRTWATAMKRTKPRACYTCLTYARTS